jgi:chromosome segregation ATPase
MPASSKETAVSRPLIAALLLAALGAAHAQQPAGGQSMEERLRAQLRATTTQLQQAQNELAVLKAGQGAAAPTPTAAAPAGGELDALKKELAQSRAQLAAERQAREAASAGGQQLRQQAQAASDKATAQVAQYRGAYDELLKLARAADAERQRLAGEATAHRSAIARCEAQNAQLYAVGQEILRAYETVDVATVLASRQPFAAQSRVKYEQLAQQYGDRLYDSKFDVRAVPVPSATASTTTTPSPSGSAGPTDLPAKP